LQADGQSRVACLAFAFELLRRSSEGGWRLSSIAAFRAPILCTTRPIASAWGGIARSALVPVSAHGAGGLPTLFAATSPNAEPGAYYGPDKVGETVGVPTASQIPPQGQEHGSPRTNAHRRILVYLAFGWLAFTGTARFIVDVLSQHLLSTGRGRKRRSTKSGIPASPSVKDCSRWLPFSAETRSMTGR